MGHTILLEIGSLRMDCAELVKEIDSVLVANGKKAYNFNGIDKLSIALVGQYNAGKSTLVNALFGTKKAVTGDGPTTKVRQFYDWRDYKIVDLPGGDARINEQIEARQAIEDAQIVLYVVSSRSGLDRDTFWSDLSELQKKHVPFFVVINDKQPHQSSEEEENYKRTILENFQKKAASKIDNKSISNAAHWINAKRAEQGRTENKNILTEKSGIIEFENIILDELYKKDSFLKNISQLRDYLDALKDLYDSSSKDLKSIDSAAISFLIERCDATQEKLSNRAQTMSEELFNNLQDLVSSTLHNGSISDEIERLITEAFSTEVKSFSEYAKAEFNVLSQLLKGDKRGWEDIKGEFKTKIENIPVIEANSKTDIVSTVGKILGTSAQLKPMIEQLLNGLLQRGAESAAEGVAEGGLEAAAGGAAVSGGEAVAETGAKAGGKLLGPLLIVAVSAWEIYKGYKEEKKEKALIESAMREAEARSKLVATNAKNVFLAQTTAAVDRIINPISVELRRELDKRKTSSSAIESKLTEISRYRSTLEHYINKLTARVYE